MSSSSPNSISQTKPYRFIRITVNGNTFNATHLDTNVDFPINDVSVSVISTGLKKPPSIKLEEIDYTTTKIFAPTSEKYPVEIFFSKSGLTTNLPAELSKNLINFFKLYKPKSNNNYCCINFAYEMAYGRGKIVEDNDPMYFDELPSSVFSENKLAPGDMVRMNKANEPQHYAISLGKHYYLSLFGCSGPLIVTTLEAMKKGFQADNCVQVVKKICINSL